MLESNENSSSQINNYASAAPIETVAKRKKPWLAAILSLVFPGLGQLYNRQPVKAFVIAVALCLTGFMVLISRILLSPIGLIFGLGLLIARVLIAGDALYCAKKSDQATPLRGQGRAVYAAIAAVVIVTSFYPTTESLHKYFRAFKVPSISMCPTICENERIVADMEAYKKNPPQPGDLTLLLPEIGGPLYIKRVIAIGGDRVTQHQSGGIEVNGKPLPPIPRQCKTKIIVEPDDGRIVFDPVTVPRDTYFVLGDNLNHSLDSRTPDFGFVTNEQIRGKPVYLYWSSDFSRIGCRVR